MRSYRSYRDLVKPFDVVLCSCDERSVTALVDQSGQVHPHQRLHLEAGVLWKSECKAAEHYSSEDEEEVVHHGPLALGLDVFEKSSKPALELPSIKAAHGLAQGVDPKER